MPTFVASQGNSGYGTTFATGTGSPPTFTQVPEVKTVNKSDIDVPALDLTQLLSPNATEELAPGIAKPGTIEVTGNYTGVAGQQVFITYYQAQTVFSWQMVAPVQQGSKHATITGQGFVTKWETGPFEPNKIIEFKVSIQMTGTITYVIA